MPDSTGFEMTFDPSGELLGAARECEARVFFETYGNTREQWYEEYSPYDEATAFIAISEPGGDVVAASRLILPSEAGLKSLLDTARPPWLVDGYASAKAAGLDAASTIDIATIAVRKGLRGAGRVAAVALYHGIVMATRANDLPNVVMIMDARARRLLSAIGCVTQVLPGTEPGFYLGSENSVPLWANVPQMMDNQRRINPDAFRLVSQGIGLTGIAIPGATGFVLRDRNPVAVAS